VWAVQIPLTLVKPQTLINPFFFINCSRTPKWISSQFWSEEFVTVAEPWSVLKLHFPGGFFRIVSIVSQNYELLHVNIGLGIIVV
jgi:hypothetical protein